MDFRTSIGAARLQTASAIRELGRYDHRTGSGTAHNRAVLATARELISPGATRAGAAALDAARWERWVTVRQIRDTGQALELLDRAWWTVGDRVGQPDVHAARRTLEQAVALLDRAATGRRWSHQPTSLWRVA